MKIEVKDREVFIPSWNGNKDAPESDQVKVHYKYLPQGDRSRYIRVEKETKFSADGKPEMALYQDQAGLTKAMVTLVENLTVGKTEVKTANQLYETPGVPAALVAEIEGHMLSAEPEVDADFLPEPSPST
jgi:hypothetical protein